MSKLNMLTALTISCLMCSSALGPHWEPDVRVKRLFCVELRVYSLSAVIHFSKSRNFSIAAVCALCATSAAPRQPISTFPDSVEACLTLLLLLTVIFLLSSHVMCFLECFILFNSSSLQISSSYYSGLILSLITHSLSSSTCYLLHFTSALLHRSPFLHCLFFPLPCFPAYCRSHPLISVPSLTSTVFHLPPFPSLSFLSLSLCLTSFLLLWHSL